MNKELELLIFKTFDWELDDYMEMEEISFQQESDRLERYKKHIREQTSLSSCEVDEISSIVLEYISYLTFQKDSQEFPRPPYANLLERIFEAEQLFEYISDLHDTPQSNISKCVRCIENAKKLKFPFEFKKWLRSENYLDGQIVKLDVSETMEIKLYGYERNNFNLPRGSKNFFVRIGQEKPETKLFEFEHHSGSPKGLTTLYQHNSNSREKVTDFESRDFWIYKKDDNQPIFSVYKDDFSLTIGNLNTESGVYLQKADSKMIKKHKQTLPLEDQ